MTERLDDLQIDGLKMYQNPEAFCFGTDAVVLSDFACVEKGERVLDLGTGNGIIPLLLSAKTEAAHITGIEIQEESAALAVKNVAYNSLEEKIDIICGDIRNMGKLFSPGDYQVITTNPPHIKRGSGLCTEDAKGIARHEIRITLEELLEKAAKILIAKGRFYMVHRPERLAEIITEMKRVKIEPKKIRFVHSSANKKAILVLIEGRKEERSEMTVMPPLILLDEAGEYTAEAKRIYGIGEK